MTPVERACLDAFRRLTKDDVPPSYEEVAEAIGVGSKSNVYRLVTSLERQGYLYRTGAGARCVQVIASKTAYTPGSVGQLSDAELRELARTIADIQAERKAVA